MFAHFPFVKHTRTRALWSKIHASFFTLPVFPLKSLYLWARAVRRRQDRTSHSRTALGAWVKNIITISCVPIPSLFWDNIICYPSWLRKPSCWERRYRLVRSCLETEQHLRAHSPHSCLQLLLYTQIRVSQSIFLNVLKIFSQCTVKRTPPCTINSHIHLRAHSTHSCHQLLLYTQIMVSQNISLNANRYLKC